MLETRRQTDSSNCTYNFDFIHTDTLHTVRFIKYILIWFVHTCHLIVEYMEYKRAISEDVADRPFFVMCLAHITQNLAFNHSSSQWLDLSNYEGKISYHTVKLNDNDSH